METIKHVRLSAVLIASLFLLVVAPAALAQLSQTGSDFEVTDSFGSGAPFVGGMTYDAPNDKFALAISREPSGGPSGVRAWGGFVSADANTPAPSVFRISDEQAPQYEYTNFVSYVSDAQGAGSPGYLFCWQRRFGLFYEICNWRDSSGTSLANEFDVAADDPLAGTDHFYGGTGGQLADKADSSVHAGLDKTMVGYVVNDGDPSPTVTHGRSVSLGSLGSVQTNYGGSNSYPVEIEKVPGRNEWMAVINENGNVLVKRLASDGSVAGSATATSSGLAFSSALVVDDTGAIVFWQDFSTSPSHLKAQKYDYDLNAQGGEIDVGELTLESSYGGFFFLGIPAIDLGSKIVIQWGGWDAGFTDLDSGFFVIDKASLTFEQTVTLGTASDISQFGALGWAPDAGLLLATWSTQQQDSSWKLYGRFYELPSNPDTVAPTSSFTFPANGEILSISEFQAGYDTVLSTSDDDKFLGTATDPLPSSGIVQERMSLEDLQFITFYDAGSGTFGTTEVFNPATITSGSGTASTTWEFFYPSEQFGDNHYQAHARAKDAAGNEEASPIITFLLLSNVAVSGAVTGSGSCDTDACSFEVAAPGSISQNGATMTVTSGSVRVVKARNQDGLYFLPLTSNTKVTCTSGTENCVFGIVDNFFKDKGISKQLVSTATLSMLSGTTQLLSGTGAGAVRFLEAIADGVHFEGSAPSKGAATHDGSGSNILWMSPSGATGKSVYNGVPCSQALVLGTRAVIRYASTETTLECQ